MIVTIVRFAGATTESVEEATEIFSESAARYLETPGLLGKAYLRAEDGSVGAIYWWTNRSDAEARFNPGWFEGVTEKYGTAPTVEFYDAPIVVDNIVGTIRTEPPMVFGGQESL